MSGAVGRRGDGCRAGPRRGQLPRLTFRLHPGELMGGVSGPTNHPCVHPATRSLPPPPTHASPHPFILLHPSTHSSIHLPHAHLGQWRRDFVLFLPVSPVPHTGYSIISVQLRGEGRKKMHSCKSFIHSFIHSYNNYLLINFSSLRYLLTSTFFHRGTLGRTRSRTYVTAFIIIPNVLLVVPVKYL